MKMPDSLIMPPDYRMFRLHLDDVNVPFACYQLTRWGTVTFYCVIGKGTISWK